MINTYLALGFYILILSILTFIASKKENADSFLRASGNIGWKMLALSTFSSIISSYNIVVGLTFAYLFGPWVIVVYLGILLSFITLYYLVKTQNPELAVNEHFNSVVDYLSYKFGERNASLLNLALLLVLFIFISLQFFVNTAVFSELLGWNKYTSSIFVGVIVLLYTFIGGLKVEIFTDVFQGILMFFIVGLVFLVDTSKISINTINPLLTDKNIIFGAISLGIVQFLTILVQPEIWQRIYAAKNITHLKKGFLSSWFLLMMLIIPLIIIGLSVRSTGGIANPDNLFYSIIETSAPKWFLPFLSVSLFAAFMSSLDSSLFAISSQIGKYGFWIKADRKKYIYQENKIMKKTRIIVIVITILTLVTSLFFSNFLLYVLQLVSLLTVISVVVLFSLLFKITKNEIFFGILVAIVSFMYAVFGGLISEAPQSTLYPSCILLCYMIIQYVTVKIYNKVRSK